jgi:hypothetical protein
VQPHVPQTWKSRKSSPGLPMSRLTDGTSTRVGIYRKIQNENLRPSQGKYSPQVVSIWFAFREVANKISKTASTG